jgi:hypothetical protein
VLARSALTLVAVMLGALGCDSAFVDLAPAQKLEVPISIFPNNGRRGQAITVIALPSVPSPEPGEFVHVVDIGLGLGVTEHRILTNGGTGCTDRRVADLLRLLGESGADRFPVCVELEIAADAPAGDFDFVLELVSDGRSIISTTTFSVLPALEDGQAG